MAVGKIHTSGDSRVSLFSQWLRLWQLQRTGWTTSAYECANDTRNSIV